MNTITKKKNKSKEDSFKRKTSKEKKIELLLKDIEEARDELKKGLSVKGSAEEIIRHLRNEVKQVK